MTDNREIYKYDASNESYEEFEARTKARRRRIKNRKIRKKVLLIIVIIAAFATLATMCGRDIVKLQNENRQLKKQQKELTEQRDKLRNEVQKAGKREYLQEQARKQLHLLNPGELLFTFEDEEQEPEPEDENTKEVVQGDG